MFVKSDCEQLTSKRPFDVLQTLVCLMLVVSTLLLLPALVVLHLEVALDYLRILGQIEGLLLRASLL